MSEREIVKEEIVTVAQEVFQRFGWKKTSVEDIAKKANKGKSTLYHYFKNKEEIFYAVLSRETKVMLDKVEAAVDKVEGFEQKLRTYIHTEFREIYNTTNLYVSIRDYWIDNFIQIEEKVACEHQEKDKALIIKIFKIGIQEQVVHPRPDEELQRIASALLHAIKGYMIELTKTLTEQEFQLIDQELKTFIDTIIYGLLNR